MADTKRLVRIRSWPDLSGEHSDDLYYISESLFAVIEAFIQGEAPTDERILSCMEGVDPKLSKKEYREQVAVGVTLEYGTPTTPTTWSIDKF